MEVHAHTHTPRKKWTHYFWEFLMLFLAVFCGFLAEYQLEHKIEKDRAKEFAIMLKQDLVNDTLSLSHLRGMLEDESKTVQLATSLYQKYPESITIGDLRWLDTTSFLVDFFISKNSTFEQMKHAGQLRYFQNAELTATLGHYDWSVKHYLEMKANIQNIYGGLSSEHVLQSTITRELFLEKNLDKNDTLSAAKGGYKFESWYENLKIQGLRFFLGDFLLNHIYPDLKSQATNIIDILNKEYHLK